MILLIDNYDSFTYNLYQYISELGFDCRVIRNDAIDIDGIRALNPAAIVISPGPKWPKDAGISEEVNARLKHGEKVERIFMQDKSHPSSIAEQLILFYALREGILDNLSVDDCEDFKRQSHS